MEWKYGSMLLFGIAIQIIKNKGRKPLSNDDDVGKRKKEQYDNKWFSNTLVAETSDYIQVNERVACACTIV